MLVKMKGEYFRVKCMKIDNDTATDSMMSLCSGRRVRRVH